MEPTISETEVERDIPKLLAVPARVRFLSIEPLLAPVDLTIIDINVDCEIHLLCGSNQCVNAEHGPAPDLPALDWVIVSVESGPGARPMHPDWARSPRDQGNAAGVPFLFKQWGEWLPAKEGRNITGKTLVLEGAAPFTSHPEWPPFPDGQQLARIGKKAAGRQLDGRTWDETPAS